MRSIRHYINLIEAADLDPSQEARLQRARDMGYDVDDPHYFGTPNGDFDELDLDRTSDEDLAYGRGAYTTRDPTAASGYSRPGASWGNHTDAAAPTVYKVYLKVKNPFDLDKVYTYPEIKRIFTHCFTKDELDGIGYWTELAAEAEDYEYMVSKDNDDDESESTDELYELQNRLENVNYMSAEELGINPDDFEDGESDPDFQEEMDAAVEYEKKSLQRQIESRERIENQRREYHQAALQKGSLAADTGRNIYKVLWHNTDGYHDWKAESQLFGGDTGSFEFKTEANRWLEELGYDGLRHVDQYNPGKGKPHVVTIAFNPNQVRSAHAQFDPTKSDSPKLSEGI